MNFDEMTQPPPGAFDDLLGEEGAPRRRRATTSERDVAALILRAKQAVDGPPAPRSHSCCRCEAIADAARKRGEMAPPVQQAESWVYQGRRYWGATCRACTDVEWSALWQAQYEIAKEKNNTREMRRLVQIATARQNLGRRLHVAMPNEQPQHAAYGAR